MTKKIISILMLVLLLLTTLLSGCKDVFGLFAKNEPENMKGDSTCTHSIMVVKDNYPHEHPDNIGVALFQCTYCGEVELKEYEGHCITSDNYTCACGVTCSEKVTYGVSKDRQYAYLISHTQRYQEGESDDFYLATFYNGVPVTKLVDNSLSSLRTRSAVVLPYFTKEIGMNAFAFANIVTSIKIPVTCEVIGSQAFSRCGYLTELKYDGTIEQFNAIEKGSLWLGPHADGTVTGKNSGRDGCVLYASDGTLKLN